MYHLTMDPSAWPDKNPVPAELTTMEQTRLSVPYNVCALLVLQWAALTFPSAHPSMIGPCQKKSKYSATPNLEYLDTSDGQAIHVTADV